MKAYTRGTKIRTARMRPCSEEIMSLHRRANTSSPARGSRSRFAHDSVARHGYAQRFTEFQKPCAARHGPCIMIPRAQFRVQFTDECVMFKRGYAR